MRPLPHFLLHRVTIFGGAMAAARASAFCSSRSCRHRQEGVPDRTPTRGPPLRRPVVSGLRPPRWPSCWLALWCPIHSLPVTHQGKAKKIVSAHQPPPPPLSPLTSVSSDLYDFPTHRSLCATPLFSASVCAICVSAGLLVAGLGGAMDNTCTMSYLCCSLLF
ncbi:hypothetical protein ACQJBY_058302 [Aegilops geniculata]